MNTYKNNLFFALLMLSSAAYADNDCGSDGDFDDQSPEAAQLLRGYFHTIKDRCEKEAVKKVKNEKKDERRTLEDIINENRVERPQQISTTLETVQPEVTAAPVAQENRKNNVTITYNVPGNFELNQYRIERIKLDIEDAQEAIKSAEFLKPSYGTLTLEMFFVSVIVTSQQFDSVPVKIIGTGVGAAGMALTAIVAGHSYSEAKHIIAAHKKRITADQAELEELTKAQK